MSPLAIPATPPPSAPNTEIEGAAAPHAQRFDDTLKQAQPIVAARDGVHDSDARRAPKPKQRDDDTSSDGNNAASATPAAAMVAPAPAHLPVVAGKTSSDTEDAAASTIASVAAQDVVVSAAAQPVPRGAANATPVFFALPPTAPPVHVSAPLAPLQGIPGTVPASSTSTDTAAPSDTASSESNAAPDATSFDADLRTLLQAAAQDRNAQADDKDSGLAANAQTNSLLAHLAQLASGVQPGATAMQTPPVQLTLQSTPGQPQFVQEAAQQVAWLAGQDIQRAEIQLNPHKLGPIQVEITTHHDRVDVSFAVQHPQTVHALQQTLPHLTDMLAQQGLNLGNASVGQQAAGQQQQAFAQHAEGGRAAGSGRSVEPESTAGWRTLRIATPGGVDDFA